ncbi:MULTISPECIES: YggT family protein [unclassified Lactococcus]|uniref:YggT family protein n=1 Tax=unclassified Lactococcus TaxID=2643510 RepID=UPI0011C7D803|nr:MULTISPECIES: YggT family protein [unclassified Lactococcus]MQW23747.1 YggT family protein [Lactococcus sp. dk101]TXK37458.1 YggT family protein [Lactococcus sp. dk310]TXK48801.1 YggT family protein [Lactococcus sp. dk322]
MTTYTTLNLIAQIINYLFILINIYSWVLVAYALMSWVPQVQNSAIGRLIIKLSQPYISLFERLPLRIAGLDLSVLVAVISLQVIQQFIKIMFQLLVNAVL